MKYHKLIFTFFFTSGMTVLFLITVMFIFDPLQLFHQHWFNKEKIVINMRQQAVGLIRHGKFDSIIIGTSMLENTSAKEASYTLDGNFINISIEGSGFYERSIIIDYALMQKNIKQVIFSLDNDGLINETKNDTSSYDYLYDNYKLNDFYAYTNIKYIGCIFIKNLCFSENIDLDRPNAWYQDKGYSIGYGGFDNWSKAKNSKQIRTALKDVSDTINKIKLGKSVIYEESTKLKSSQRYIDETILKSVIKYPNTSFILIVPPYSRIDYAMSAQYYKSDFHIYKKNIRYLVTKSNEYKNLKIFAWGNHEFVDDINNYKDPHHYEYKINTWMLKAIKRDEGLLNLTNIDNYLDTFTKKALEYDLIEFGKAIRKGI